MARNLNDLADFLYSDRRAEVNSNFDSGHTTTIYGTAVGNSSDGTVMVTLSDDVTQPDSIDGEAGVSVELPTTTNVKDGDEIIVTLVGGDLKTPFVSGVVGAGDRVYGAIDDSAANFQLTIEETQNDVTARFTEINNEFASKADVASGLSDLEGRVVGVDDPRMAWISLGTVGVQPALTLGESGSDFVAKLTNTEMGFYDGSSPLAIYGGVNGAYMPKATIPQSGELHLGGWMLVPRANGNLTLKYVGG